MACYVASGLGLLLTTSYLGLRRYLRQRKLKMPVAMTGTWLALGGGLIVVLMVVGALLPRPYGEYQLFNITPLGSKPRKASEYAIKRDDPGTGQGRSSTDQAKDDQKAESGSGTKPDSKDGGSGQGKASDGNSGSQGKSGQGQGKGKQGQGKNKSGNQSGKSNSKQGDQKGQGGDQEAKKDKESDSQQGDDDNQNKDEEEKNEGGGSSSSKDSNDNKSKSSSGSSSSSSNPVMNALSKIGWVATALKWIVFSVLALIVLYFLLTSGLKFLANFTDWAKRLLAWWQGLFQRKEKATSGTTEGEEEEILSTPLPFASFHNPFLDGRAEQLTPAELARYSFEALQSWAWEHDFARQQGETPIEFAERLAAEVPAFENEVRRLASLYARVAYARGTLTPASVPPLRQFWERLEAVVERPVSA
jgi:hypothetical protein